MKRLDDFMAELTATASPDLPPEKSNLTGSENEPVKDESVFEELPDYMYTSPQIVGFGDEEVQRRVYQFMFDRFLPLSGEISLLELGAGRGDFAYFLHNISNTLTVSYTGVEVNSLLVKVGIDLQQTQRSGPLNFNLVNIDPLNDDDLVKQLPQHDFVVATTMTYIESSAHDLSKTGRLSKLIEVCLSKANVGCKLLFVATPNNPGIINYTVAEIASLLDELDYPFIIDGSAFELNSLYSVTIFKSVQI